MDAQAVSNAPAKNGLVGLATSGGLSRRVPRARQGAHCLDSGGWRGDAGDRP